MTYYSQNYTSTLGAGLTLIILLSYLYTPLCDENLTTIFILFSAWLLIIRTHDGIVSHEAKKQHAFAYSDLRDHYSKLFTWMVALKFENAVTQPL